jgi:hypothetical protein
MVFYTAMHQYPADPDYRNPQLRTFAGYKEMEAPMPPQRRNRDFKPLGNGTFRGYPKGRNSVPYNQLRQLRDLTEETHQTPIRWLKMALKGALMGWTVGSALTFMMPQKNFEVQKLHSSVSGGPYSFKLVRYFRKVMLPYMAVGALAFFSYEVMGDLSSTHGHTYGRPRAFEDFWKFSLISGSLAWWQFGIRHFAAGAVVGAMIGVPIFHALRTFGIEQR